MVGRVDWWLGGWLENLRVMLISTQTVVEVMLKLNLQLRLAINHHKAKVKSVQLG